MTQGRTVCCRGHGIREVEASCHEAETEATFFGFEAKAATTT